MSGQLREEIAQTIQGAGMVIGPVSAGHLADALLAGPLRPLVAAAEERDALRATVERCGVLAANYDRYWGYHSDERGLVGEQIRRAVNGGTR